MTCPFAVPHVSMQGYKDHAGAVWVWAGAERSGTLRDMLNEEQDGAYERKENVLHYNIDDRDSWLRTVDSTPSNAFGRSFACRRAPHCRPFCMGCKDATYMHTCMPPRVRSRCTCSTP